MYRQLMMDHQNEIIKEVTDSTMTSTRFVIRHSIGIAEYGWPTVYRYADYLSITLNVPQTATNLDDSIDRIANGQSVYQKHRYIISISKSPTANQYIRVNNHDTTIMDNNYIPRSLEGINYPLTL